MFNLRHLAPIAGWLLFLWLVGPDFLLQHWEGALVVFAALALVPTGLHLLDVFPGPGYWLAAGGLAVGYGWYPHPSAVFFAVPYLLLATWLMLQEGLHLLMDRKWTWKKVMRAVAITYWTTGAAWAICWLAGFQPLGFDTVIVGLTAAHFHVAGFVLTVAVYSLYSYQPNRINRLLGWAALLGMPLVATGITLTRLGYSPWVEQVSAAFFAAFALGVLVQHLRLNFQSTIQAAARWAWTLGALCLLAGAVLASLYALRFSFPMNWINIPNMKIWHGTLNAVGFGWLTLQGWRLSNQAL